MAHRPESCPLVSICSGHGTDFSNEKPLAKSITKCPAAAFVSAYGKFPVIGLIDGPLQANVVCVTCGRVICIHPNAGREGQQEGA